MRHEFIGHVLFLYHVSMATETLGAQLKFGWTSTRSIFIPPGLLPRENLTGGRWGIQLYLYMYISIIDWHMVAFLLYVALRTDWNCGRNFSALPSIGT